MCVPGSGTHLLPVCVCQDQGHFCSLCVCAGIRDTSVPCVCVLGSGTHLFSLCVCAGIRDTSAPCVCVPGSGTHLFPVCVCVSGSETHLSPPQGHCGISTPFKVSVSMSVFHMCPENHKQIQVTKKKKKETGLQLKYLSLPTNY